MAEELFIPKLGQTVDEVTLINWLVKDGNKVEQGQGVLEVETDKAVFTVEAAADGFIHIGPYKAGDVVPNLTVVALIGKADEKFISAQSATGSMKTAKVMMISTTAIVLCSLGCFGQPSEIMHAPCQTLYFRK